MLPWAEIACGQGCLVAAIKGYTAPIKSPLVCGDARSCVGITAHAKQLNRLPLDDATGCDGDNRRYRPSVGHWAEDLNAVVDTVSHKYIAARVNGYTRRKFKSSNAAALPPPCS